MAFPKHHSVFVMPNGRDARSLFLSPASFSTPWQCEVLWKANPLPSFQNRVYVWEGGRVVLLDAQKAFITGHL